MSGFTLKVFNVSLVIALLCTALTLTDSTFLSTENILISASPGTTPGGSIIILVEYEPTFPSKYEFSIPICGNKKESSSIIRQFLIF